MEMNSKAKECGERLRRIRMAQNMSQQELADKLFTTPQNISKYEKEGISNIDIITKLSDILGYNLLRDEIDEEGKVGEIGKEILTCIVENEGYIDVNDLIEKYMHGLDMKRITNEIFKLQKIGLCVREQFTGYAGKKNDGLFITAKGIITLKNNLSFMKEELEEKICKVPSFEEIVIGEGYDTYQEVLDSDELEQLLWSLPCKNSYRADYIKYLKNHFQYLHYYGKDEDEEAFLSKEYFTFLSGENVYFDILHRMIMELDNRTLDTVMDSFLVEFWFEGHDENMLSIRKELMMKYAPEFDTYRQLGTIKGDAILKFYEKSDWYSEYAKESGIIKLTDEIFDRESYEKMDKSNFSKEDMEKALEYDELNQESYDEYKYVERCFDYYIKKMAEKKESRLVTEWFSKDEIVTFINENMSAAQSDEEMKIDETIKKINEKYPETLEYYTFPEEWEENGIADLIRKNCNI